jgi:hypothetical protein
MDTDDGFEDRADGGPSLPELGGHEGSRRTVAEDDSEDGQVLEDITCGQVSDPLTMAPRVLASTAPGITPRTVDPGLLDQLGEIERPTLDGGTVDGKIG